MPIVSSIITVILLKSCSPNVKLEVINLLALRQIFIILEDISYVAFRP